MQTKAQKILAVSIFNLRLDEDNDCIKAMIKKGLLKANYFNNSAHKLAYFYVLTRKGIDAKTKILVSFLARKMREYEAFRSEIEVLKLEVEALSCER